MDFNWLWVFAGYGAASALRDLGKIIFSSFVRVH